MVSILDENVQNVTSSVITNIIVAYIEAAVGINIKSPFSINE